MYTVSTPFLTFVTNPQRILQKKFTFPEGINDYSTYLTDLGSVSQRQFEGEPLNGADLSIELSNISKTFNYLMTSKNNISKIGKVQVGFPLAAPQLNGSSQYVSLATFALSGPTLTVEAIVKITTNALFQTIIGDGAVATGVGYLWVYRVGTTDHLQLEYATGSATSTFRANNFFTGFNGAVVHVAVSIDYAGKAVDFYRNGVLTDHLTTANTMLFPSANRVRYIGTYNGASDFLSGTIGEVAIYTPKLSAARIKAHSDAMTAKSTSYKSVVLVDSPVGYWRLGELQGATTAADLAATPHNGTYVGSPNLSIDRLIDDGNDGELIDRYRGYLEEVEFFTDDRARARLTFSSKAQRAIEREIGSNASPVDYSASWSPAALAWELLTTQGGLDATASTANVDIDYSTWLQWATFCDFKLYSLSAYFTGQSIAEGLRLIGQLTDTLIYGETDGKFYFKVFRPQVATSTPYLFTEANAHIENARLFFNKARVINKAVVWYGYIPGGSWEGSTTRTDGTSQTNYGLLGETFDSTNVWHANYNSADSFAMELIYRYPDPAETVVFTAKRGSQAPLFQLGDPLGLTWSQVDYAAKIMKAYGIRFDLSTQETEFYAEVDNLFNKQFFILDTTNSQLGSFPIY